MTLLSKDAPFIKALRGEKNSRTPVWLMRQAGRYLPEYRALRQKNDNFLDFCLNPQMACEATLQPLRRFDLDAAIIFSDILVIPQALGRQVTFTQGDGPKLDPLKNAQEIASLHLSGLTEKLSPVYEALSLVKTKLTSEQALIGFCGGPFTLAVYMIEGGKVKTGDKTRIFAYQHKEAFKLLIDILTQTVTAHLKQQALAGADILMIFDSWAGLLPTDLFTDFVINPTKKIRQTLKEENITAPLTGFPRLAGTDLFAYAEKTGVEIVSLDTKADPSFVLKHISPEITLQGNLDPMALVVGGEILEKKIRDLLNIFKQRKFIFNLGHGVVPETPVEHVEKLIRRVHQS